MIISACHIRVVTVDGGCFGWGSTGAVAAVAGFIGEPPMNFFDATASPVDGRVRVHTTGFELLLSS